MTSVLITAPTDAYATTAEIEQMLGLSSGADPALAARIAAVGGTLDAATQGWLGRALRPQTWELRLPGFPCEPIRLPYPPVTAVSSVKYYDGNGTDTTAVADTDYRVIGLNDAWETTIQPIYNGSFPSARCDVDSVRIQYIAGYALTPADLLPAQVKMAIALGAQQLRSYGGSDGIYLTAEDVPGVGARRWAISDAAAAAIERSMMSLLAGLRVYA